MWKDAIVEEARKHRDEHAKRFGYDLAAICRDLRQQQRESGRRIVTFSAKKPCSTETASLETHEPSRASLV